MRWRETNNLFCSEVQNNSWGVVCRMLWVVSAIGFVFAGRGLWSGFGRGICGLALKGPFRAFVIISTPNSVTTLWQLFPETLNSPLKLFPKTLRAKTICCCGGRGRSIIAGRDQFGLANNRGKRCDRATSRFQYARGPSTEQCDAVGFGGQRKLEGLGARSR